MFVKADNADGPRVGPLGSLAEIVGPVSSRRRAPAVSGDVDRLTRLSGLLQMATHTQRRVHVERPKNLVKQLQVPRCDLTRQAVIDHEKNLVRRQLRTTLAAQ